jgi:soluble lytic murein transglycosylase
MTHRAVWSLAVFLAACNSSHEASAAGDVSRTARGELARAIAQVPELESAQAAIDAGHPWRATQIVAPLLRDASKRSPAAVLVAARSAAGWEGWSDVDRLLAKEAWVDAQFDGDARELLAQSAFARGDDTSALAHAGAALREATTEGARNARLVLLARAFERNNLFDSAAIAYARAAVAFRPVRDWLLLRAAGNERDSTKRAAVLSAVTLPAAKPRVAWTEAQVRERFGDTLGAAARYASLGATVTALRLRLLVARDSASRNEVKNALLTFVRGHTASIDVKAAVDVLDKGFAPLAPAEELIVARGVAVSGPPARAIAAFAHALEQPTLFTPNDRILYGQALARAGRTRDAANQFAAVQGPLGAQAAYLRARLFMTSGSGDATRAALRDIVNKFPRDTAPASAALYLLADLLSDAGDDVQAGQAYRQLYQTYPSSAYVASARFRAAMLDLLGGRAEDAAQGFDSVFTLLPHSDDATAARYWSGRAWAATGNDTQARARWSEVVAQQPTSYYSAASARRLGRTPWTPPARADSFPTVALVDSAFARAALLERLGMDAEARLEYDAIDAAATATGSTDRLLATAHAFRSSGQPARAMRLAQRLIDGGERDARAYRLLYPVIDREELTREANARGLDPALVAGLIRQESAFSPRAASSAGARGLMQVLPAVGEEISRSLNYPFWRPVLLFDADANLQIGTAHLASYTKRYGALPRVLAAYNAGGSRVARWSAKDGVGDAEVFTERIPFVETRDYVRLVQRNAELYRRLYTW